MRARPLLLIPVLLARLALAHTYPVDGIVLAVDPASHTMLVSHRPIPHYMPAMAMPFRVDDPRVLGALYPGARVAFDLVVDVHSSLVRNVRKSGPDAAIPAPREQIHIGDLLPDFRLTDQSGRLIDPASLRGKVAAIDFIYTRCPLPDVCPRLSANFALLQRRFHAQLGSDLVLLSVTVDPEFDTPAVLADYAKRWAAEPAWHFLTGGVGPLAAALGEVYWSDEGSIGHNSTTSIVGRNGRLAAVVEGSNYRVDQLENLIALQLEKPK
jgi:protein SCO1/2